MVDLIRTVEELEHLNPQILVGSHLGPQTQVRLVGLFFLVTLMDAISLIYLPHSK